MCGHDASFWGWAPDLGVEPAQVGMHNEGGRGPIQRPSHFPSNNTCSLLSNTKFKGRFKRRKWAYVLNTPI